LRNDAMRALENAYGEEVGTYEAARLKASVEGR
jgi:hypothetical protein